MATTDANDLSERFLDFAVRVIKLVNGLPADMTGRHIAGQLLRSGTSAGANYEEARGGESTADFVHKMALALKEAKESRFWLRIVHGAEILKPARVAPLLEECEELCAILGQSVITAKKHDSQTAR